MSADETRETERDGSALEARYYVKKLNDAGRKHDDCRYFVLDPQHDPLARKALVEYSRLAVEAGLIGLAADLRLWVRRIEGAADLPAQSVTRVHNHPPYRPVCKERRVGEQLRGACLNDDGTDLRNRTAQTPSGGAA